MCIVDLESVILSPILVLSAKRFILCLGRILIDLIVWLHIWHLSSLQCNDLCNLRNYGSSIPQLADREALLQMPNVWWLLASIVVHNYRAIWVSSCWIPMSMLTSMFNFHHFMCRDSTLLSSVHSFIRALRIQTWDARRLIFSLNLH